MPVIRIAIEDLRLKFNRLRNGKTFIDLQEPIGVHRVRLSNFATGGRLGVADLEKIDNWCDLETERQGEATHGDT